MRSVALISVLLMMTFPPAKANALTAETISVTETGGIVTSGQAGAKDTEDAQASVRSVIQGGGQNTSVRLDISASAGKYEYATSVTKTIQKTGDLLKDSGEPSPKEKNTNTNDSGIDTVGESGALPALTFSGRLSAFLSRIFDLVFFFW